MVFPYIYILGYPKDINRRSIIAVSLVNTTCGKGGFVTIWFVENWLKNVCEKLCITMKLSHYPSKLGPEDIS